MQEELISCSIEGVTPLLCNRFTDASQLNPGHGSSLQGDRGTPREQAETKLYVSADGKLIIPQPNIFRCLIDAGTYFKAGKTKVTTMRSSIIPACVDLAEIEYRIQHREPWTVDTRAVRIPSTGGRILCHRPCFHDWKLDFEIKLDTSLMSVKLMREIVDAAGKRIGLGDFRPACKGPFGKFVVVNWVVKSHTNGRISKQLQGV